MIEERRNLLALLHGRVLQLGAVEELHRSWIERDDSGFTVCCFHCEERVPVCRWPRHWMQHIRSGPWRTPSGLLLQGPTGSERL
jgi:hypothetical protein